MLPPIRISQLDQKAIRATVAMAINTHLHGAVTMHELSAWALKFFHAINQLIDDEQDASDDDEEMLDAGDPAVLDGDLLMILDELMFADTPEATPSPDALRQWATQLMR